MQNAKMQKYNNAKIEKCQNAKMPKCKNAYAKLPCGDGSVIMT